MKGVVISMNWGSLIQTVLPTIGTVVGQLLGVKSIEEGVIFYRFSKAGELEGSTGEFSSTFFKFIANTIAFAAQKQQVQPARDRGLSYDIRAGSLGSHRWTEPLRQIFSIRNDR